jgi:hypothetical protein
MGVGMDGIRAGSSSKQKAGSPDDATYNIIIS